MGGLRVLPSTVVSEVEPADVAALLLPGGDRWESSPIEPELEQLLNRLDAHGVPIAAICGATVAIARLGLLRGRRHTSNGLEYLRDVEFARELFEELDVLTPEDREAWATIFRSARLPATSA
jgi:putative intracellular protease/amidase